MTLIDFLLQPLHFTATGNFPLSHSSWNQIFRIKSYMLLIFSTSILIFININFLVILFILSLNLAICFKYFYYCFDVTFIAIIMLFDCWDRRLGDTSHVSGNGDKFTDFALLYVIWATLQPRSHLENIIHLNNDHLEEIIAQMVYLFLINLSWLCNFFLRLNSWIIAQR